MHILVVNSGSSSVKFSIFDARSVEPSLCFDGEVSGVGTANAEMKFRWADGVSPSDGKQQTHMAVPAKTPADAMRLVLDTVCREGMPRVDAAGYRVVHPGAKLDAHQRITPEVLHDLKEAVAFAPLHDPAVLDVIREGMERFPQIAHYACFDTVFHGTMPVEATTYPVPEKYREQGVRRYGFHGLSCESIVRQMRSRSSAEGMEFPSRMAIAHLGSGCSVTAIQDGRSIDTTMGLTPTGGVVMGTRPGDLDPGLMLWLVRQQKEDVNAAAAVEKLLNHACGVVALSGMANDVKEVRAAATTGNEDAKLALKVFTRSVTKAIGSFCWLMGGLDAIVFAGGIGEHDFQTRAEILGGLEQLGICVNLSFNKATRDDIRPIHASESKTAIFVVPAQEDLMIALHVSRMARSET